VVRGLVDSGETEKRHTRRGSLVREKRE
jgi:hypothetical protein